MPNKAIKYRIYPNEEQRILFAKTFGCCRKVWNLMLEDKMSSYENTGTFGKQTPAMYKDEHPYLREVDSLALANVQQQLRQAIKSHFDNSRHFGFPNFKAAKTAHKSYTTNNQHGTVAIKDGAIRLPKLGLVKAKLHRLPPQSWVLKAATVSQDSDGKYYASILFAYEQEQTMHTSTNNALGLDYKSDGLYMDSNGVSADIPKFYRAAEQRLAKEQRRLSRKVGARQGETRSNNYCKQMNKKAKLSKHVANQRKDFLHKLSTEIANSYDVVCVESLNMQTLANKGFGNGKATLDNGYGMFLHMLEYKLHDRGKYLVKVDQHYPSSQICHCCGNRKKLSLSERTYSCICGYVGDRDHNAAINIRNEGLRLLQAETA